MKKIIYLSYLQGVHPAHRYQAKAVSATIMPYTKFLSLLFKRNNIVISEGFRPLLVASQLKMLHHVNKHINILLGDFILGLQRYYFLQDFINLALEYCDAFIANSTFTMEIFQKYFGKKHRIEICWPLANLEPFIKVSPLFKDNRTQERLCYLGHLTYYDGADLLPKIFLDIKDEFGKNIEMYIIGNGPLYESLSQIKIEGFHVLGYQPINVVKKIFSKCQFFIYPARFKCFGLSVIEAMVSGLIPLVTERTGARDFVRDLDPNLVVPLNIKIMERRIGEMLTMDPMLRKELSIKAKQIALSWNEKASETFLKIISNFIKNSY
jgi:glycosyltransferase involved in cell wall biosynthesis